MEESMRGSKKIKYIFEKLRVYLFFLNKTVYITLFPLTRSQHYPLLYQDVTCRCFKMLHMYGHWVQSHNISTVLNSRFTAEENEKRRLYFFCQQRWSSKLFTKSANRKSAILGLILPSQIRKFFCCTSLQIVCWYLLLVLPSICHFLKVLLQYRYRTTVSLVGILVARAKRTIYNFYTYIQWGRRLEDWPNTAARLSGWRRVVRQVWIFMWGQAVPPAFSVPYRLPWQELSSCELMEFPAAVIW